MNSVERFKKLMSFGYVDRLPMIEFAPYWDKTLHRWYDEGLDRKLNDDVEIRKSFGLDTYRQFWFTPKTEKCPEPLYHGASISLSTERLQDNV